MRVLAAIALLMALGACAEVTKFQKADGSAYYFVDCAQSMRLIESCGFAARRTCPNGYVPVALASVGTADDDRQYTRCQEANNDRREDGLPEVTCTRQPRNEGYFACK